MVVQLSARQSQVLDALLSGLPIAKLRRRVCLSEGTVKNHISQLLLIFGVRSRSQLLTLLSKPMGKSAIGRSAFPQERPGTQHRPRHRSGEQQLQAQILSAQSRPSLLPTSHPPSPARCLPW